MDINENKELATQIHKVYDLNLPKLYGYDTPSWWKQFVTDAQYNDIKSDDRSNVRLIFEALEIPLKALQFEGIDEVSRNADGTLWGSGRYFANGKGKILTSYDDVDYLSDNQCNKAFKALSAYWRTVIHERKNIFEADIPIYGYRFAATGSPIDIGPSFSMRKKATVIYTLDDYVKQLTLTESQRVSLAEAVKSHKNILIVGATGSGKTTFANAILHEISQLDPACRMAIIEETSRELQCNIVDKMNHLIPPSRMDGKEVSIDAGDLLKAILRRSPDRITLGEVRDGAAVFLLQAWNSGHPGGLCTIHADSALGGLHKFEQYLETGGWKVSKEMISANIHIVVSVQKKTILVDGKYVPRRIVEEIVSVDRYHEELGDYKFSPL